MAITLLYYFDMTDDGKLIDTSKVHFCHKTFDQNVEELKYYFASTDVNVNDIEFQVYAQNKYNLNDGDHEAIRCMMSDIKNEASCTHKLIAPLFDIADSVEKKTEMLRYLLEKYFIGTRLQMTWANDNKHIRCYRKIWGIHEFKYWLPKTIAQKYDHDYSEFGANGFDIIKMTPEEILTYVVPEYYSEIGFWDMKSFRDDPKKMEKVSVSWLK